MSDGSLPDAAKVSAHWGQKAHEDLQARQATAWMNHPLIERDYIHRTISGSPDVSWLEHVKRTHVPKPLSVGLTLGCGEGGLERHALALGICERFEAIDIAEAAIAVAREKATREGLGDRIKYSTADINEVRLDPGEYDIAFCSMSAHHFARLEHVFSEVRKALRPPGLLAINEFVGPSQFQWSDRQLEIVNDLLRILPDRYRRVIPHPHDLKERYRRPTINEMNRLDPSESIRSAEIVPLLEEHFQIIERVDYGGTVLQLLMEDIAGNFSPEQEQDTVLLRLLCHFEAALIKYEVLSSDFSLIIARRKEP